MHRASRHVHAAADAVFAGDRLSGDPGTKCPRRVGQVHIMFSVYDPWS